MIVDNDSLLCLVGGVLGVDYEISLVNRLTGGVPAISIEFVGFLYESIDRRLQLVLLRLHVVVLLEQRVPIISGARTLRIRLNVDFDILPGVRCFVVSII